MSALPASLRISPASSSTRFAIFLTLKAVLIFSRFMLQDHLEQLSRRAGQLESVGICEAADPDDLPVPYEHRNAISFFGGDFTINQKVLQLFVFVAVVWAAVADDERGRCVAGLLGRWV